MIVLRGQALLALNEMRRAVASRDKDAAWRLAVALTSHVELMDPVQEKPAEDKQWRIERDENGEPVRMVR